MATIKDVARHAEVSVTTVSHVVNGTRRVSPEGRERVEAAIRALGYVPSAIARSLKSNNTRTLGMLIPNSSNPYFAEIVHSVEDRCFGAGYNVILCNTNDEAHRQGTYLQVLAERRIDGLIVVSTGHDATLPNQLAGLGIPTVRESDASLGVANQVEQRKGDVATALPSSLATAATFDPEIAHAGGAMIGSEARAKTFNVLLAGGVNLTRDPWNGRNFEYLGEDPLLAGVMAGEAIRGVQSRKVWRQRAHRPHGGVDAGERRRAQSAMAGRAQRRAAGAGRSRAVAPAARLPPPGRSPCHTTCRHPGAGSAAGRWRPPGPASARRRPA